MGTVHPRILAYEKPVDDGSPAHCTIEQFTDGSVYVVGDELGELIFEFAPDSFEKAVEHVERLGYVTRKT